MENDKLIEDIISAILKRHAQDYKLIAKYKRKMGDEQSALYWHYQSELLNDMAKRENKGDKK